MTYHFSGFTLDIENLELRQNGELLNVEPQVFSLLAHLIENRDRVVSKDELIDAIWEGRIITDGALNTRINAVRKAVDDDGKQQKTIKTFQRRGFRFVADVTELKSSNNTAPAPAALSYKPSIIVLPFTNLSDDSDQEYFADGLTEDVITGLSKFSSLVVIGRYSSFYYKEKDVEPGQIGQELGVDYALQGSVRKAGNRVRIAARLLDLKNNHLLWAENHDGTLDNVFDLQDEITEKILSALSIQLTSVEQHRLLSQYTDNPEARDWFIRGRIRYRQPGPQANREARDMLDQAIALDPKFAWAYAIRSYVRFHGWFFKWNTAEDALSNAFADAQKSVALDPDLAAGHSYLGWISMWIEGAGHVQALAEHEIALGLDPNFADGHIWYGSTLIYSGQPELSIEPNERALKLDPHYPPFYLINFGNMYLMLGRYEEAKRYLNEVRERSPDFPITYIFLAAVLAHKGDLKEARIAVKEILKRLPWANIFEVMHKLPYIKTEHQNRLIEGLRKAGLPD